MNPSPVAKRRPADGNIRNPDVTVTRVMNPVTMRIELVETRVIAPNEADGFPAYVAGVQSLTPLVERVGIVAIGDAQRLIGTRIHARNLVVPKRFRSVRTFETALPFPDSRFNHTLLVGRDPVQATLAGHKPARLGLDGHIPGVRQPQNHIAGTKLDDRIVILNCYKMHIGARTKSEKSPATQLHFDSRVGVGNDPVTVQNREVDADLGPVYVARRLVSGRALD
jgi:hypothetical protein